MARKILIVGAGSRGLGVYAEYARTHPHQYQVVGCAEPCPERRQRLLELHPGAVKDCHSDWTSLLEAAPAADAVILATPDREHRQPALAFMEKGYDLLLEKPMDISLEGCQELVQASRQHRVLLVVAHVMRYTHYFTCFKELVSRGLLGQLATVRHLEPVHYWHQAHSFVRGNWRNQELSAPMILAKSCHDLDLLCYLVGEPVQALSSFGRLSHFRPDNRPPGAAARCLDCPLQENQCAYSAPRIYLGMLSRGQHGWPVDVVVPNPTPQRLLEALKSSPYGRCVYACDNDVVDHQVVALEFASGVTGTFTMTAFTEHRLRTTEMLGSEGQLLGDGLRLIYTPFGSPPAHWLKGSRPLENGDYLWDFSHISSAGHSGGDEGLMQFFFHCLEDRKAALQLSLPEDALRGHELCFLAEVARHQRRLIEVSRGSSAASQSADCVH